MNYASISLRGIVCPVRGCPKKHNRRFSELGMAQHLINKHLVMWRKSGYITGGKINDPNIEVSKDFWDFMCQILWLSYVNYKT